MYIYRYIYIHIYIYLSNLQFDVFLNVHNSADIMVRDLKFLLIELGYLNNFYTKFYASTLSGSILFSITKMAIFADLSLFCISASGTFHFNVR